MEKKCGGNINWPWNISLNIKTVLKNDEVQVEKHFRMILKILFLNQVNSDALSYICFINSLY